MKKFDTVPLSATKRKTIMAHYGIIDFGSNTIRLCIYSVECTPRKPLQKKDIDILLNYKVMAGLAAHIKDGAMTNAGIKKAIKTINAHLRPCFSFFLRTY